MWKTSIPCTPIHTTLLFPAVFSPTLYSLSVSRIRKQSTSEKSNNFLEYTLAMSFNDYNSLRKKIQFYTFVQMRPGKWECSSIYRLAYCCWRRARSQVARVLSHIKRKQRALFPYKSRRIYIYQPQPFAKQQTEYIRERYLCIILGGDSHIEEVTFYTNIWSYVVYSPPFTRIHSNTFKSFLMLTQIYSP